MKLIKKNNLDNLSHVLLIVAVGVAAVAIYRLRYDSALQLLVILVMVVFYVVWGFVYHYLRGDLEQKLILEYLLMAMIASFVYLVLSI